MTLSDIKALVVSADCHAGHYESAYRGSSAYTIWKEVRLLGLMSDDGHAEGYAFQIDRFTKTENDAVAAAIRTKLDADPRVAYSYQIDFEPDTRYIHHIFDCEGY